MVSKSATREASFEPRDTPGDPQGSQRSPRRPQGASKSQVGPILEPIWTQFSMHSGSSFHDFPQQFSHTNMPEYKGIPRFRARGQQPTKQKGNPKFRYKLQSTTHKHASSAYRHQTTEPQPRRNKPRQSKVPPQMDVQNHEKTNRVN